MCIRDRDNHVEPSLYMHTRTLLSLVTTKWDYLIKLNKMRKGNITINVHKLLNDNMLHNANFNLTYIQQQNYTADTFKFDC